jgi:hypothetical protein
LSAAEAEPMLPTDQSAPTPGTLARLSDPRVRQVLRRGSRLGQAPPSGRTRDTARSRLLYAAGDSLDPIAVYPVGAQWTDRLPVATFFNGPVVDAIDGMENALRGKWSE